MSGMWQRRSSSMRTGQRSSQDPLKQYGHVSRNVDRGSRIPVARSSSQTSAAKEPPVFKRSKSTLGPHYTPQEKLASAVKITPLGNHITPNFFGSYSSKKPNQKDHRNLNDKDYQREASYRVLSYFQNNYSIALKDTDIRPMTRKLFLDMVNHLFARLGIYSKDGLVQFTPANYEKDLRHWMSLLDYPGGSISKSTLQTVNVPQNWPNVLGILSWLVSLVEVTSRFDMEKQLMEGIAENKEKLLTVQYLKGCLSAHNRFAQGEEDAFDQVCSQVVQIAEQVRGVTDDVFERLKAENATLLEKVADPDLKMEKDALDELEQRLAVAESQSMKAIEEMEAKSDAIEHISSNILKKERNIESLKGEIVNARQEVELLKKRVESQSMSVTEFTEIQKKCDYVLKEISYMEKECEDNQKLVARYEQDIAIKRDKILQNASTFNRHVIQLEQQVPELQGLRARMNPESADVVEEVERLVEALRERKTTLTAEWEELDTQRREVQQRVESLKQRLRDASASQVGVRERVDAKKLEIENLKKEFAEKEKALDLEMKELEKRQTAHQRRQKENDCLREKAAALEKRFELLDRGKEIMKKAEEKKWERKEEQLKQILGDLTALENQVISQEKEIEGLIDELVADFYK